MTKWCLLPCVYSSEFDSLVFGEAFLCLCLHGIEYPQRLYYNEKQSRFSCHCSKRDMSRRGHIPEFR